MAGPDADVTLGYKRTTATDIAANPAVLTANGLTSIDHQTIGRATETSPSVRAAETRWGSFIVPQDNLALEQEYGAQWLSGGWHGRAWSASVGVDNATNRYPDKTTSAGNLNTNGISRTAISRRTGSTAASTMPRWLTLGEASGLRLAQPGPHLPEAGVLSFESAVFHSIPA